MKKVDQSGWGCQGEAVWSLGDVVSERDHSAGYAHRMFELDRF
jgi:hypothetical protein